MPQQEQGRDTDLTGLQDNEPFPEREDFEDLQLSRLGCEVDLLACFFRADFVKMSQPPLPVADAFLVIGMHDEESNTTEGIMPEFKVMGANLTLNFGMPTIILVQFDRNKDHVVLEWYLLVRPHNHQVSKFIEKRRILDRRPNVDDIRNPTYPDIPKEVALFHEEAKAAFIDYGMNLPQNVELKPKQPEVVYNEFDNEQLYRMISLGTGHDQLRKIVENTESKELRDYLRNILAIVPKAKPAPNPYDETSNELDDV